MPFVLSRGEFDEARAMMSDMDFRLRILCVLFFGTASGALFSGLIAGRRRGAAIGLLCGICVALVMAAFFTPFWMVLLELMPRLT